MVAEGEGDLGSVVTFRPLAAGLVSVSHVYSSQGEPAPPCS